MFSLPALSRWQCSTSKLFSLACRIVAREYALGDARLRNSAVADVAGTISSNLVERQTWSRSVCTPVMLFSIFTVVRKVTFSPAEPLTTAVRNNNISVHSMMTHRSRRESWHRRNFVNSFSPVAATPAISLHLNFEICKKLSLVNQSYSLLNDCVSERIPAFNSPLRSL